jgi:hypothetical protein
MKLQFRALILAAVALPGLGQSRRPTSNSNEGVSDRAAVDVYISERDDASLRLGLGTAQTSEIFKGIGIRLKWHTGELPAARSSDREGAGRAAFGIRTVEHAPASATAGALASAEVSGSFGVEITLYKARVKRLVANHPSLERAVVGYVLAHELAHVMQGVPRHSGSGILKAQWSKDDFERMMLHELAFSALDAELIHRGLAVRLEDRRSDAEGVGPAQCESLHAYDLRVFIIGRAQTQPLVLHAAVRQTTRLLADAGVRSSWKVCSPSSILPGSRPCAESGPLSLTLRVLPSKEAKAWPIEQHACGMALAGAPGEHGSLAIVDAGCVARRSAGRPGAEEALSAHVFAHELGHLLLGRDSHSTGLMSAEWAEAEQAALLRGRLAFIDRDAARLREAIADRALASAKSTLAR